MQVLRIQVLTTGVLQTVKQSVRNAQNDARLRAVRVKTVIRLVVYLRYHPYKSLCSK
jgi:hypothetical protein